MYLYERANLTLQDLTQNARIVLPSALDKANAYNYTFQGHNWAYNPRFKLQQSNVIVRHKESESGRHYKVVIDFIGIEDGERPSYSQSPCRVSCGCAAYYFYYSKWNADGGAHARGRMKLYVPVKNPKRIVGPLNPRHLPGICKHIAAYADHLLDQGYIDE